MRVCVALCLLLIASAACADEDAWAALGRGEAFLLMRHALAPGVGDPPDFRLEDCTTQRVLSQRGIEQARAWGEFLRSRGLGSARLLSSRWCRSLDTAKEMRLGRVEPFALLDSFFQQRSGEDRQMSGLKTFLQELSIPGDPLVLITHQVNITALTGIFPASGEALLIALPLEEPVRVLARIPAPDP